MSYVKLKGTSLTDLLAYVKDVFPNKYQAWLDELPIESQIIFKDIILNTEFYDVFYGHIEPLRVIGKVCFDGDEIKAAYECGKYGS